MNNVSSTSSFFIPTLQLLQLFIWQGHRTRSQQYGLLFSPHWLMPINLTTICLVYMRFERNLPSCSCRYIFQTSCLLSLCNPSMFKKNDWGATTSDCVSLQKFWEHSTNHNSLIQTACKESPLCWLHSTVTYLNI